MQSKKFLFWLCIAITVVFAFGLFCFNSIAREAPQNVIVLTIFSLAASYTVAGITIYTTPENVAIAAACTLVIFLALTLLSLCVRFLCFTSVDEVLTVYTKRLPIGALPCCDSDGNLLRGFPYQIRSNNRCWHTSSFVFSILSL